MVESIEKSLNLSIEALMAPLENTTPSFRNKLIVFGDELKNMTRQINGNTVMRRTNKTGNPSKKSKASNADPTQYFHIIDDTKQNNSECRVTYSQFMANGKPVKTKEDRYRDEPICCVRITLKNYTDNKKVMKEILERSDYVIR
uniref:SPK domain-containing protein n=1 Tax=Strongyloides papillosus TaxID=174720 RepID=A0A0N5CIV8_STREA